MTQMMTPDEYFKFASQPNDEDPATEFAEWPTFPFAGPLTTKALTAPEMPEPPRRGENGEECTDCEGKASSLWQNGRWRIHQLNPTLMPVGLMLQPVDHYDAGELPDELAAELGVLMNHLTAAIEAQEFVGRAHVNRWGDGGAHLHFWFMGRPIGQLQMRGSLGILWADLGQALPQRVLDSNHRLVLMNFVARAGGEMAA
ncbi:hypothetical protein PY310_09260 [Pseudarthrobacter sp. H3Y2-7]|jgi:hypothetical protein|uniref:hypothetical protein n=1 Tax=Pseudarthrobacter TaxID=1742993 RepID=UPI0023AF0729|nr:MULTISPECIES: hypothetical protein [unclassified Pseudarthrobacter]MDE8668767.1 hypothetical protein [Pseudarthrobacter sp. H3Y2-7]